MPLLSIFSSSTARQESINKGPRSPDRYAAIPRNTHEVSISTDYVLTPALKGTRDELVVIRVLTDASRESPWPAEGTGSEKKAQKGGEIHFRKPLAELLPGPLVLLDSGHG